MPLDLEQKGEAKYGGLCSSKKLERSSISGYHLHDIEAAEVTLF